MNELFTLDNVNVHKGQRERYKHYKFEVDPGDIKITCLTVIFTDLLIFIERVSSVLRIYCYL